MKTDQPKIIEELFLAHKVLTISTVAQRLGRSEITARRVLKKVGYYSSYTHNSQYYTIKSVVRFNSYGIWCHNHVCFSEHGTLKATMIRMIDESRAGLTVSQLSEILRMKCYAAVHLFHKQGAFNHIKRGKGFIYLSKQESICQSQLAYYTLPDQLTTQAAIELLVYYVDHPGVSYKKLERVLKKRHFQTTSEAIESFFKEHGVKKTPTY